jgi:hypothetical protein
MSMKAKFTIPGRLPSLNEIIATAQYNRYSYGTLKKKATALCAQAIIAQRVPYFKNPVFIRISYFEPNYKRDLDGVFASGMKFILDALGPTEHGGTGRILNDTRKWVKGVTNLAPLVDSANPRIEIVIREASLQSLASSEI